MDAYRAPAEPIEDCLRQFVDAVLAGRADRMEYFFDRLPTPPRSLPRTHSFQRASPRITLSWRPTRGDFILSFIAREALAGPWRIGFDSDVLGYAFDEHIAWTREPTADQLAILRGARMIL